MSRTIRLNLLFNLPSPGGACSGEFLGQNTEAAPADNSRVWLVQNNGQWAQLPALPGKQNDSVLLQQGDSVSIYLGEKYAQGSPSTVQTVQLATVFGRLRGNAQALGSPFGTTNPICLFMGQFPGQLQKTTTSYTDRNGANWYVDWYVLQLGSITDAATKPNPNHYELMIGSNVSVSAGGSTYIYSFGHDPEVDIGMDQQTTTTA